VLTDFYRRCLLYKSTVVKKIMKITLGLSWLAQAIKQEITDATIIDKGECINMGQGISNWKINPETTGLKVEMILHF
jgi:hypothetical protein